MSNQISASTSRMFFVFFRLKSSFVKAFLMSIKRIFHPHIHRDSEFFPVIFLKFLGFMLPVLEGEKNEECSS